MKKISFIVAICVAFGCYLSCKKNSKNTTTYDCTGVSPTYTANIKSIMDSKCATSGCHSATSKASGYDLSSYTGVKNASSKSAFMGSIEHSSGYDAMPKGSSQLSTDNRKLIYCWIQNSTPN